MACGQKKQNTNEGGVHLTERTCSPYNPIIKQIVDDCLGLPIYPVSSIDAVIDEDGNTLRKLLNDLLDQIKSGSSDVTTQIENILSIVDHLDDVYVSETEFSAFLADLTNKLKLLYKISSMNQTDDSTSSLNYDGLTTKPHIVAVIEDIQEQIQNIIGGNGTGLSLEGLQEAIENLNSLLLSVANYDTRSIIGNDDLVFSNENTNHLIEIIYKIESVINDLEAIKDLIGIGDDNEGTLIERIEAIEGQIQDILEDINDIETDIRDLKTEAAKHAHLDEKVLVQMPAVYNGNKEIYQTLKAAEYPPTTIDFLKGSNLRHSGERLEYQGFLEGTIDVSDDPSQPYYAYRYYDVYPTGHTDQTKGHPLFYKDKSTGEYVRLLDTFGNQLMAGNGVVSIEDIDTLTDAILGPKTSPKFQVSPEVRVNYEDLYFNYGGEFYLFCDYQHDNEPTIGDLNAAVDMLLSVDNSEIHEVATDYSPIAKTGWIVYFDSYNQIQALYPCIEGKLYVDSFTGNLYRYTKNNMIQVSKQEFYGSTYIKLNKSTEHSIVDGDNNIYEGPYEKYIIQLDSTIPQRIEELESSSTWECTYLYELNTPAEDGYYLYEGAYPVIPSAGCHKSGIHVDLNGVVTVEYSINSVTSTIDYILSGVKTSIMGKYVFNHLDVLKQTLERQQGNYSSESEEYILLNNIIEYLQDTVGVQTDASDIYIKAWSRNLVQNNNLALDEHFPAQQNNVGDPTLHLGGLPFLSVNGNQKYLPVYYLNEDNGTYSIEEIKVSDPRYIIRAGQVVWDFSGNGGVTIDDVTSLIDYLLTTGGTAKEVQPVKTFLSAILYQKAATSFQPVQYVKGRLFHVNYPATDEEFDVNKYNWWYFDDNNSFRPVASRYELVYEANTNSAVLLLDGFRDSEVQFSYEGLRLSYSNNNNTLSLLDNASRVISSVELPIH